MNDKQSSLYKLVFAFGLGMMVSNASCVRQVQERVSRGVPDESMATILIGGIEWLQDYDAAIAVARKANKPIWLHFGENPG